MILNLSRPFKNVPKKEIKLNYKDLDFSENSLQKLKNLRNNSVVKCL
ncbi:hypothetical protein MMMIC1C10_11390 [Methanococcus maripaludis]